MRTTVKLRTLDQCKRIAHHLVFETVFYEADFFFGLQISRYNSVDSYIPITKFLIVFPS